jgi:holin-like protein
LQQNNPAENRLDGINIIHFCSRGRTSIFYEWFGSPHGGSKMLRALVVLFTGLFVGNLLNRLTGVPVPGPVIGLLIMLAFLVLGSGPDQPLRQIGHGLLRNMSILFVPAGVGLITQLPALEHDAMAIGIAILVSTALGMAATAGIMHLLAQRGNE